MTHIRQPRQPSWSTSTMPSSARLYIAPDGQLATQAGLRQCSQMRGRWNMKVFSNSSLTLSPSFFSTGSPGACSGAPPRSSSQFADQRICIGLAGDEGLGPGHRDVGLRRGVEQRVVLVGPRLVVVRQARQLGVAEDAQQPLPPPAGAQLEPAPPGADPAALPPVLVLVAPGVAQAGPGLHVVEPHVLDAGPVGPRLLAGDRAGVAADALVEVHDHAHLGHDAHQYSTSCERRRMTVTSSRWLPVGP